MNIKRFMSKKVVAVGLAAGITLGIGGAAFAFWTTTGSGSGSATVGSAATTLPITGAVAAANALIPGGTAEPVVLSVKNVETYTVSLLNNRATASNFECNGTPVSSSWFTLSSGAILDNTLWAPNSTSYVASANNSGLTLTMNDDTTNSQDVCQGAALTFDLSVTA